MIRICFVCLGNICRSPTAEGVMKHLLCAKGLGDAFSIDSAGTSAYHVGEPPDRRSTATARRRGIELGGAARQFEVADFERFDLVIAMDQANFEDLAALAPSKEARARLHLLRSFEDGAPKGASVPDPYYGGASGFDDVLDICEAACAGLLEHLRSERGL